MGEPRSNKRARYDEEMNGDDVGLSSAAEGFFEALCKYSVARVQIVSLTSVDSRGWSDALLC